MHKSEQITDAVYSSFQESELKSQIASLGGNGVNKNSMSDGDVEKIMEILVRKPLG